MAANGENFGGTNLVAENGDRMDPAIAGILPPPIAAMHGDGTSVKTAADWEEDDAGEAEMDALTEEDATGASPTENGEAADESAAQPS